MADSELLIRINKLTGAIIGAAIEVHKHLGAGLLESAYEACLEHELKLNGLKVERQKALPVMYKGILVEVGYRMDLVVEDLVVVELKAVDKTLPLHEAQLLSYVKISGLPAGLLINFHVRYLKDGVVRRLNDGVAN